MDAVGGSGPAVLTVITVRSSWMMAKGGPGSTGDCPPNHSNSRRFRSLFCRQQVQVRNDGIAG